MAFADITMKNPQTGSMKIAPVGFSWTVLFFGPFPPLLRGDFVWSLIILIACFVPGLWIIFAFIYNKIYIKGLVKKGFKVNGVSNGDLNYISAKVGFQLPVLEN